jgi:hypothetical protein
MTRRHVGDGAGRCRLESMTAAQENEAIGWHGNGMRIPCAISHAQYIARAGCVFHTRSKRDSARTFFSHPLKRAWSLPALNKSSSLGAGAF